MLKLKRPHVHDYQRLQKSRGTFLVVLPKLNKILER